MRFLQIGLGSMGKRRIRNLRHLGHRDVVGFDVRAERRSEATAKYAIDTVESIADSIWPQIDAVIVSTPPDLHHPYVLDAILHDKHVFVEASVLDDGYDSLLEACSKHPVVVAPSCTMRFDPIVARAKSILGSGKLGRVLFASHHFGQCLHQWHPYEKITDFYVSRRSTGAAREIVPFDLSYLTWLIGFPRILTCIQCATGTLGVDIDDIYSMLYVTEEGVQVHASIDVLSKVSYRDTRIIAEFGNLELDNVTGKLDVFYGDRGHWEHFTRDSLSCTDSREEMYVLEMGCFLDAISGGPSFPYTLQEDRDVLSCLYAAERSCATNTTIALRHA